MMYINDRILVLGGSGLVGQALLRYLMRWGYTNVTAPSSKDLDLTRSFRVLHYMDALQPRWVFMAAGYVSGIYRNSQEQFAHLDKNFKMARNLASAVSMSKSVEKVLYLGSSCIYPKMATQPITEEQLLDGKLEPTNEGYALGKIAGIKMFQYVSQVSGKCCISAMPCNLYGPDDHFGDPYRAHVIPALISRFSEAVWLGHNEVELFGDGSPIREFMYVDDLAEACVFLMNNYDDTTRPINVGSGFESSIKDLAHKIASMVGFRGEIKWSGQLNGTPRKLLDSSNINDLGWKATTRLGDGMEKTVDWWSNALP